MNPEWALVLKFMSEPRQSREQYKTLPPAPAPVVAAAPAIRMSEADRAMVRAAIRRAFGCATGKLAPAAEPGALAVPEFRAGCMENENARAGSSK